MITDEFAPAPDEVVEQIRAARSEIEAIIEELPPEQMTDVRDEGGWSIKDHLAHIAEWQRHALALLHGVPPHEAWGIDRETHQQLDLDGINAMIHERNLDRSLSHVLREFRKAHEQGIMEIERLSEDDLQRDLPGREPDGWVTIGDALIGTFVRHDTDHVDDILTLANEPAP